MNLYRWIAVLALTGVVSLAFAQAKNCAYYSCSEDENKKWVEESREESYEQQRQRDEEFERRSAPERAEQARQQAENDAALKALRARLLASPALPPDRNPLLGRWRVATGATPRGGDDLSQLLGMLANPGAAMCEVVFGGGIIEFKPGSWASNDSAGDDSLGPIQYRTQDKQVFALPDQGLPLLGFDIVDTSTIREFRLQDCVLVRVGAQPTAAPAARAAQPTAGAAAPVAAARSTREPIEPVSRLGRGVQLHGEKDFQQALQQLLVAAQSDPNDPRVYVYLADTYGWLGMDAEAKQAAERAKQLDPNAFEILR
jgi:tetratricopeptide (TPR) repeat protein